MKPATTAIETRELLIAMAQNVLKNAEGKPAISLRAEGSSEFADWVEKRGAASVHHELSTPKSRHVIGLLRRTCGAGQGSSSTSRSPVPRWSAAAHSPVTRSQRPRDSARSCHHHGQPIASRRAKPIEAFSHRADKEKSGDFITTKRLRRNRAAARATLEPSS